jgi:hypothetical protein
MKDHTTAEIFEELWKRIEYDANVSEELASESNELQDRINKAIEYISEYRDGWSNWFEFTIDDKLKLLDILKGSDKE